ncbi:MAG: hypothetical protein O7J95_15320 [Planctomycetota bacterium]|nr:hypothetical protein [Planctomycetota bacterium]
MAIPPAVRCVSLTLAACLGAALAAGQEPLSREELEARRKKFESWTFEPVVLDAGAVFFQMDRRDSSFYVQERRSGVRFYSSLRRRGYATVELRDGRRLPIDRCDAITVSGEKIRFAAASNAGDVPLVWLAIATDRAAGRLTFEFDVPEESRPDVAAVTLLEESLWIADSDGGGIALPRGMGEWLAADSPEALRVRLDGVPQTASSPRLFMNAVPETSYSVPFLGIQRGEGTLLLTWKRGAALEVARRIAEDERFPGRRGLFLSLRFPSPRGRFSILGGALPQLGPLDVARVYLGAKERELAAPTLRFKCGEHPGLEGLPGALIFRPRMAAAPRPPAAAGEVLHTFDEVARIAERLRGKLEVDQALFILEDWLGSGSGKASSLLPAAVECGGDAGLADCSRRIRDAGYVFGLAIERDHLIRDATAARPRGESAWASAAEAAGSPGGFPELRSRASPQLLVVREPPAEGASSPGDLLDSRAEFIAQVRKAFPLWGTNLGSELDVRDAAYLEGFFHRETTLPEFTSAFPLFASAHGRRVRLAAAPGEGLRPDDAAGVLHHLLFGEAPVIELPPRADSGGASRKAGDGPEWCFARPGGWTEGRDLTPHDVFIKNVFEVCSYVSRISRRERLALHRPLTADGLVRESYFGHDLRIVVNFGPEPYEDQETETTLPRFGFLVRYPFFFAFHATRVDGHEYATPAFFTVRSLEGKMYLRAEKTRIYRGFGPETVWLGGKEFRVEREKVVKIW